MIQLQARSQLPTIYGNFEIYAFSDSPDEQLPEMVLQTLNLDTQSTVNLRIHSECLTGDIFHSQRCDCGEQLNASLQYIAEHGGMLLYLRQEGRGIGIINKLKAYNLQDQGFDTAQANVELGFQPDERNYQHAVEILDYFKIKSVNLLTNNPEKVKELEKNGITVEKRIPLEISPNSTNSQYLQTKKDFFGHYLNL